MRDYYDTEWGLPVRDERGLFERLSLEAFQSGLSWATILRKRPAFRAAFRDFDPDVVAGFDDDDRERLLGRRRHRAEPAQDRRDDHERPRDGRPPRATAGSSTLVWSLRPGRDPATRRRIAEVPTTSPESRRALEVAQGRGLRLRRPDDHARADGGRRHRRHPPGRQPPTRVVGRVGGSTVTDLAVRPLELRLETDGPYDAAHAIGLLAAHSVPGAELTDVTARHALPPRRPGPGGAASRPGAAAAAVPPRLDRVDACSTTGPSPSRCAPPTGSPSRRRPRPARAASSVGGSTSTPTPPGRARRARRRPRARPARPRPARHPHHRQPRRLRDGGHHRAGQQVSLAAARTFAGRLVAALGTDVAGTGLRRFPRADVVAALPVDELRAAVGVTGAAGPDRCTPSPRPWPTVS